MEFTVMTFNLRYNEKKDGNNDWPHRVDQAADLIRRYRPSAIGMQEGLRSMLDDLQARLPGYAWVGEGRGGGNEDEHNAIFYDTSLLCVQEWGQFWLSETPEQPNSVSWDSSLPRICTWARLQSIAEPGLEWMLYNTHLDHIGQEARVKGAALIRSRMERYVGMAAGADASAVGSLLPAVLTGDFNAWPSNPAIVQLRSELFDAYRLHDGEVGLTAHSFHGGSDGQPIDYIFASAGVCVLEAHVIHDNVDGRYPSDHYPVLARMRIEPCERE
ncbi:endonuclease/exonuclease/phosphatase family protein [Paenibacillus ferrarius]|uniref:endonuclease/exonuclease/phosphatase family protein n=1 Tax=Paenibacillus ferrarius TaxID=1469647 RepID=UPI003D291836